MADKHDDGGRYVQIGDVSMWFAERGSGEPLVLLHPGHADARAFATNIDGLAASHHVLTPEQRGHGRTADVEGPISYERMALDTIGFIESELGGPTNLLGHSDGAAVGLLVAVLRPDLVRRLVFSSAPFHHKGWIPGAIDLDDESAEFLGSSYGEISPDGPKHFTVVGAKLDRMHREEPDLTAADLADLKTPTLIMMGDDDEVETAHIHAMHRAMPDAQLAIVPGAGHGHLMEKPQLCNAMILDFLAS